MIILLYTLFSIGTRGGHPQKIPTDCSVGRWLFYNAVVFAVVAQIMVSGDDFFPSIAFAIAVGIGILIVVFGESQSNHVAGNSAVHVG